MAEQGNNGSVEVEEFWIPPPPEETHGDKFFRKVKQNPLVPLGMAATVGILISGVLGFLKGDQRRQQMAMRGRVFAQGATVLALVGGLIIAAKQEQKK